MLVEKMYDPPDMSALIGTNSNSNTNTSSISPGPGAKVTNTADGNNRSSQLGFLKRKRKSPLREDSANGGQQPLKSEGKRLEDGAARDKGVVNNGFGTLPTRWSSPIPYGVKSMKNGPPASLYDAASKINKYPIEQLKQSFSSDGSGRPASQEEIDERMKRAVLRESLLKRGGSGGDGDDDDVVNNRSNSLSPKGKNKIKPSASTKANPNPNSNFTINRPQTAKQFRRAFFG
jgi:hypothetical protein